MKSYKYEQVLKENFQVIFCNFFYFMQLHPVR